MITVACEPIKVESVTSVYSGKNGKCCCGCTGKHYTASAHRDLRSKTRGYPVGDDEISDKMVKKVVRIVNEDLANGSAKVLHGCVSTVRSGRLYVAYTVKGE